MNESGDNLAWLELGPERVNIHGTCSIGRSASNQLSLPAEKVSRRHAIVHAQENNEYWLVDLGSSNGTYLNGRRVSQPVQLRDFDQIDICTFRILFRQRARPQAESDETVHILETIHEVRRTYCWLLVADITGSTRMLKSTPADELAAVTGRWLAECKQIVEEAGGSINKFLGDGFFAYWHDREKISVAVVRALETLKRLQAAGLPDFRIVVHYGEVFTGAGASLGEESLSGPEVNFIFRMEKLAAFLAEPRLSSDSACNRLVACLPLNPIGQHRVPGFEGEFAFHRF